MLRKLGEGGLGGVYEATSESHAERVAVKFVRTPKAAPEMFARARAEYQALATLTSKHVARVGDFGRVADDAVFIVQEFVDGTTLHHLLPLPLSDALVVARGVADALADAHGHGFIHRDIKPRNVIIPRDPRKDGELDFASAKLLDFGVAGLLDQRHEGRSTTLAGQIFGTPIYMSPEQVGGKPQTPSTDVYGLGVLLYEMIYGRPPFGADSAVGLFAAILGRPAELPDTPMVPPGVRAFVASCLAKNGEDRPADGSAAQREINGLIEQFDVRVTGASVPAASAFSTRIAAPVGMPVAGTPSSWTARAKQRWPWLVAGGLTLLGIGALVVAAHHSRWLAVGMLGLATSWGLAWLVHRWIAGRRPPVGSAVATLLGRATALDDLTKSLALDVGKLVEACRQIDEQILAKTLALMIGEYDKANASSDRQAALMKAIDLMEKLQKRLSPWYVRHQALLSWSIGLLGSILSALKITRELWVVVMH